MVVDTVDEHSTPEQLRLVGIQVEAVGLHPAVETSSMHADRRCCRSQVAGGLLKPFICVSSADTNRAAQSEQLKQR